MVSFQEKVYLKLFQQVIFQSEVFHIICPATSFTFSKANDASTAGAHDTRPARNNSTGTYLIT